MRRIFIAMLVVLQCLLFMHYAQAQTVEGLRLKRNYSYDNLDKIIDAIGQDMSIRFIFDREHLNRYKASFDPLMPNSKEKTVGAVLKVLRKSWDMSVLVGEDGFIYIACDDEHLAQLQNQNKAVTVQRETEVRQQRTGFGPIKTDFTLTGEVTESSLASAV